METSNTQNLNTSKPSHEVKVQIGVGFRKCIICGRTFAKDMQHPKRQKCPECFERDPESKNTEVIMTAAEFREMKRCEQIEEEKRSERQRKRDAAWARLERENGVKPRFEYHGDKLVEIRGRCS